MALFSLTPEWRRSLWMGSLVFLSVVFSLSFSCAAPLAAFAAIGGLTLRRHDALVLIGAVWLANQITGFALLHYPLERAAFAWGGALGAVALLATLAACWVNGRLAQRNRLLGSSAAFLAAFAAYEGALFAISAMTANGHSNFAPAIVLRIFMINATAFAALFLVRRVGFPRAHDPQPSRKPALQTELSSGCPLGRRRPSSSSSPRMPRR
jgi:hypothetical protein